MSDNIEIAYDKQDLRNLVRALKAMDEQATEEAKRIGYELAELAVGEVRQAAQGPAQQRIAQGGKASKSSKIGEMTFGYRGDKFSGGGTGQQLWPGYEFGSGTITQFRPWSGQQGRGSKGKFIYPTLRRLQATYVAKWEAAFDRILKEWG